MNQVDNLLSHYIDVHCHLPENYFYKSIDTFIKTWKRLGIKNIVSVSQNYRESLRTIELSQKYPKIIIPAIGIHPWKAHKKIEELSLIKGLLSQHKQIRILGEIGLDKHFIKQTERYPLQQKVLDFFFELAEQQDYRLMLHVKGAEQEIIDKIETSSIPGSRCCVHWFSGTEKTLQQFIDLDCYFSCGPALKYSTKHQQVPKKAPLERLLTESDGNVKYQGTIGQPSLIPDVTNFLSDLVKNSLNEIQKTILNNFHRFLEE